MSLQDPVGLGPVVEAYGIGSRAGGEPSVVARLGDRVIDLHQLHSRGLLNVGGSDGDSDGTAAGSSVFRSSSLNRFLALGSSVWRAVDEQLTEKLRSGLPAEAMSSAAEVRMELPVEVADFCDFYASENHAANMGQILRPGTEPLPAAWRTIPLGYHGRAGTVVVSGTPIRRPMGVLSGAAGAAGPVYGPSRRLDVEVELGYIIGSGSTQGAPVTVGEALDHVFGVVVLNDWSARDIQAFEYQPLGPFLGKSFATSISPWVVPMRALAGSRIDGPEQGEEVAPHLAQSQPRAFDINLELSLNSNILSRTNARFVSWSVEQFVAHLTSNGASLRTGDILATGTISGPDEKSWGSLMELAWGAERPFALNDGQKRTWLEDGDTATIRASIDDVPATTDHTETTKMSIPMGDVTGKILPANSHPTNTQPANS
jgi:fumarylacetoacetase